jgi:hypothetical protein
MTLPLVPISGTESSENETTKDLKLFIDLGGNVA